MDGRKIAPCIFRTPHVHVGRIRKEPGKAVRLCPGMDGIPQRAREGGAVIAVQLSKRYALLYEKYNI